MLRLVGIALITFVVIACTGGGSDVRTIRIEARDGACEPAAFDVEPGQRIQIVLENDDDVAYSVSDPEGRIEAITAEPDSHAEVFHQLPSGTAAYLLNCTAEGGSATVIHVNAGGRDVGGGPAPSAAAGDATPSVDQPDATIAVSLADFTVTLGQTTVAAGRVMVIATNVSPTATHELNILQLQPDGSFVNVGEVAAIAPQEGGSVLANLRPGTYRIACQIQIGESGSTVDHYKQGMWQDLIVEE